MTSFTPPFEMGARIALVGMGKTNFGILDVLLQRDDLQLSLRDKGTICFPEGWTTDARVRVYSGEGYLDALTEDYLFLSPTVRVDAEPIQKARLRGAKIFSDVSFFLGHTKSVCFGVTGSDGKSTTVSLADALLCENGERSRKGGNIGKVLMPYLFSEEAGDFTILELSSFQLQLKPERIKRGLITNLTPNHLDFHFSLEEYYNAKLSLLYTAEEPVLNTDDSEIVQRASRPSPFISYSMEERVLVHAEHEYTVRDDIIHQDGLPYLSLREFAPRGRTFQKNIVASLALCHGHHTRESALRAIRAFRPLAHRRELVREANGVSYYNCSADSTPSRTIETLSTFSSPIVLIVGGRSKGVDYGVLAPAVRALVRYVILCGENAEEIHEALSSVDVPCVRVASLSEAVKFAKDIATEGDAVVFSPASTSFDQYQNFEVRGASFSSLVNQ
ncbi:MAG: UDP-N-acetylmuramoyl-L-alanine--D-glutamate ligase [Clostridia bacterium]|nr:UDP-N-acetylmuramoyl-L-alanine--D-glutamate ligase [Clostridia bacterium]